MFVGLTCDTAPHCKLFFVQEQSKAIFSQNLLQFTRNHWEITLFLLYYRYLPFELYLVLFIYLMVILYTGTVISKYSPIGINTLILTLTLWNIIAHRYAQHFIQLIRSYWKINKIIKLFILGLEVQGHRIWNYSSMSHCILHNRNMCFKRFN